MNTPQIHDPDRLRIQALTDLDAAPPAALTTEQQRRADATLATILSAREDTSPAPVVPMTTRSRRHLGRGILLVAAALALTLVISMSGLIGGGTAYASWTARPTQLPISQQEELAQRCRDYLADPPGAPQGEGIPTSADLQGTDLVLAATRGDWSYVVLRGANSLEATCLIDDSGGWSILPGRASASAGSYGFIDTPTPAADEVFGTSLMGMSADEGSYWTTEGHVGSNVRSVQIVTDSGTTIDATLTGGRFAAWWPERVTVDDAGGLAQVRYRITLADGTVLGPLTYGEITPEPTG